MLIAALNFIFSLQAEIFLICFMNAVQCRSQPCTLNPAQIYCLTRKQEQEGLLHNWYNLFCWINLFLWLFLYWQPSQKVSDWMFMPTCVLFCDFCPWLGSEVSLVCGVYVLPGEMLDTEQDSWTWPKDDSWKAWELYYAEKSLLDCKRVPGILECECPKEPWMVVQYNWR